MSCSQKSSKQWKKFSYVDFRSELRPSKYNVRELPTPCEKQHLNTHVKKTSLGESLAGNPASHVGKYDRADDRPKLAMLAANVGYRYWTDDRSRLG